MFSQGGMRAATLAVVVATSAGVIACGDSGGDDQGSSPAADKQQAADTVKRYYAGMADADTDTMCAQLTAKRQAALADLKIKKQPAGSCKKAMTSIINETRAYGGLEVAAKVKVTGVKVDGDSAVATVRFSRQTVVKTPLKRVAEGWRIDSEGASSSQPVSKQPS